jgi:hypothetical protein
LHKRRERCTSVVDPSAPPRSRDRTRVPTTRHSIVRVTWLLARRIRRERGSRNGEAFLGKVRKARWGPRRPWWDAGLL